MDSAAEVVERKGGSPMDKTVSDIKVKGPSDTEDGKFVQTHVEQLREDKEAPVNLKRWAKQVRYDIDHDPSVGYETVLWKHYLVAPFAYLITLIAFLKTLFWAIVKFIYHEEYSSSIDEQGSEDAPKVNQKIGIWFDSKAFLRVWWMTPLYDRGEKLLPKYASLFVDGLELDMQRIRHGSASWKALDVVYNHPFGEDKSIKGMIDDFWVAMLNGQGVRNRGRLVEKMLLKLILEKEKDSIKMLSIACGSSQQVLRTVKKLKDDHNIRVDLTLLDLDKAALDHATELAKELGVSEQLTVHHENIRNLEKVVEGNFDIIEMLGWQDYRVYVKAVSDAERIRNLLSEGGYFLTCNILPNLEQHFVRWVLSWPMIYRQPEEVSQILLHAGFTREKIQLIAEPQKVHLVAIGQK